LEGLRFAVLDTIAVDDLRDAPRAAFAASVAKLESAGARVTHEVFPELADAFGVAGHLYAGDSYGWWRDRVEAAPEKMFPQILERVRGGAHVSAADYVSGWNVLRDLRRKFAAKFAGFDAVIMPTAPTLPPNAARLLTDDTYYKTENLLALRNTRIGNLMDLTAITLPTDTPSCGIMFNTPKHAEARLLRIGVAAEAALRAGTEKTQS